MMKKRAHAEEHVNLERYLVSYADFMTLMFILFMCLYALKGQPAEYVRDFAAGIRNEWRIAPEIIPGSISGGSAVPLPLEFARQEQARLEAAQQEMWEYLDQADLEDKVDAVLDEEGLTLRVQGAVLFSENSAAIRPEAHAALNKIGDVLAHFPSNPVLIEGHVDTIPFAPDSPYQSSWKLGADRAVSVAEYLLERDLLAEERVTVISYGENRPLFPSDTAEHRARNRRVEITLMRLAPASSDAGLDGETAEPIVPIPGLAPPARSTTGSSDTTDLPEGNITD